MNLTVIDITKANWRQTPGHGIEARCLKCGTWGGVTSPVIALNGYECPTLVCRNPKCDFSEYVHLEDCETLKLSTPGGA